MSAFPSTRTHCTFAFETAGSESICFTKHGVHVYMQGRVSRGKETNIKY